MSTKDKQGPNSLYIEHKMRKYFANFTEIM